MPVTTANGDAPGDRLVVLGRIGAPWGVRGWVRLTSYTDPRAALLDYRRCRIRCEGRWQDGRIVEGRMQGDVPVARFEGVDDRDKAASWRGAEIGVARSELPDPGPGHYYWTDLEGMNATHRDGPSSRAGRLPAGDRR
ncbi:MAG: ribosome maturation factor RimM [Woeseiaceae bacterium]|nr:ribosome maturation factor RimM [Woeseiaceae bacterium]